MICKSLFLITGHGSAGLQGDLHYPEGHCGEGRRAGEPPPHGVLLLRPKEGPQRRGGEAAEAGGPGPVYSGWRTHGHHHEQEGQVKGRRRWSRRSPTPATQSSCPRRRGRRPRAWRQRRWSQLPGPPYSEVTTDMQCLVSNCWLYSLLSPNLVFVFQEL